MMKQRVINPKKVEEVNLLKSYLAKYHVVGLAKIEKVPANAFHRLRDSLRKDVTIRVSKKRLVKIAFKESGKQGLDELADKIEGITAILLTDMNPIKLAQYLESKAVKGPAKAGDIAPMDILVKEGDTKLAPGPIISELNQNLKLPTLIKNGTVHIRSDTITHKKGEVINDKQAQLLSRLGIEPITVKLDFYAAWENGELIPTEVLHMDEGKILSDVRLAVSQGLNLALSLGVISPETIEPLIAKSVREANALALELPIIFPDMMDVYVSKAVREASVINSTVFGTPTTEASKDDKKSSKSAPTPEEKKDDEPAGLGDLFG